MRLSPLLFTLMFLTAAGSAAPNEPISVCDALSRRDSLRHTTVAIRGLQVATDEGVWLEGSGCRAPLMIGGRQWRPIIWMELSANRRTAAGFGSTEDLRTSFKRIDAEIRAQGFDRRQDRLWITYIGVFEPVDEKNQQAAGEKATAAISGFGHLNAAPAALVVMAVKDATVEHVPKTRN